MAAPWIVGALSLAGLAFYFDFKSWQSFGTGGTPPTLRGYLKIRRWGLYLFFKQQNLLDTSAIPKGGKAYLDPSSIPHRPGPRPTLTRWTLPQRQHPEPITPSAHSKLSSIIPSLVDSPTYSAYITSGPSKTEGGTGTAIYVKPDVDTINPVAHKIFYEVAHVHPKDNSLHVYVSSEDARLVVERGWAQRFPVTWLAPPGWIMVYAPRDDEDVGIVKEVVRAAVCFAVGKDLK